MQKLQFNINDVLIRKKTKLSIRQLIKLKCEDLCIVASLSNKDIDEFKNIKVLGKGEINEKAEMISVER